MDSACLRKIIRHCVWSRRVHRNSIDDCRAPRRICAGVVATAEMDAADAAVLVRSHAHRNLRRMALGRRLHRLRTRVSKSNGLSCFQRRERQVGLHGYVELGPEPAADAGRNNPDVLSVNAQNALKRFQVHNRSLGSDMNFQPSIHDPRKSGFGLDIRMFHERSIKLSFHGRAGTGQSFFSFASSDESAAQDVFLAILMDPIRTFRNRCFHRINERQRLPPDRKFIFIECAHCRPRPDDRRDGFASESRLGYSEHRLLGISGYDAEIVATINIRSCEDCLDSVSLFNEFLQVLELEMRARVRGSNDPHEERVRRSDVVAEPFGSLHFELSVKSRNRIAYASAPIGRCAIRASAAGIQNSIDYFSVARAPAKDASERVLDFNQVWLAVRTHKRDGGNEHAGRADAALRRSMLQERSGQETCERFVGC